MANSLNYQFSPVSQELKKRMREKLKGNQYKIMDTIADEVYLFPDTRLTLTKELATRYLAKKTGVCQPLVVTNLNKLEKKQFIKIVKSHVKGEGSLITILLDNILISNKSDNKTLSNFTKSDNKNISNNHKLDSTTLSNQEIKYKEKDQESGNSDSDPDSFINLDMGGEQAIEEKTIEPSFNSNSEIEDYQESPAVIFPGIPGSTAAGNNEFSSLGSVLPALNSAPPPMAMVPDPVPHPSLIAPAIIEEGKKALTSNGFGIEEVKNIVIRIAGSMAGKGINNLNGYFLQACKKEVKKGNNSKVKQNSDLTAPKKIILYTDTEKWKESQKKEEDFEETLKGLMKSHPQEIYQAIQKVDKSPDAKWIPFIPSLRAVYYVKEFRKMFSEVKT